jgi:hypothetical protein
MREKIIEFKNKLNNNNINHYSQIAKEKRVLHDKIINNTKLSAMQTNNENFQTRYTKSAIVQKTKQDLAIVNFDVNEYFLKVKEQIKYRSINQRYYDYDLELDFSINTQDLKNIDSKIYDDRWYYYKAHHFLKLGLFLKKDVPAFKVKVSDLSPEMVYELTQLDYQDRKFVLKQAISRIFEDINFDLFHNSISSHLEVKLVE